MRSITWVPGKGGCWICTSHARDQYGYPQMHKGRFRRLARYVYEQHKGPIPPGLIVRHECDTPACINPAHLILGTHADNVADRVRRGRSANGVRNGRSKLTPALVRLIRASAESVCDLARRLSVDPKTVRQVRDGKTWRGV